MHIKHRNQQTQLFFSWQYLRAWRGSPLQSFPSCSIARLCQSPESLDWSRHSHLVLSPEASRWALRRTSAWWPYSTSWSLKKSLKGRFATVISSPMPQRVWIKAHFCLLKCDKCVKKHHRQRKSGEKDWERKRREREKERARRGRKEGRKKVRETQHLNTPQSPHPARYINVVGFLWNSNGKKKKKTDEKKKPLVLERGVGCWEKDLPSMY